ncbi:hypothetical protein KST09_03415 [Fusobacterium animalis]|uniref:hypothetical protein n=1 Tax=Fusobacterium animalis TaxID=76859 RepID=UPI0030D5D7A8
MLEIRKIENIKDKFGLFKHKVSRPNLFKEIYGINQLSAFNRDGSYSSWDFTGTIDEVNEYEKRWCSKGTNGFGFIGVEVLKGFQGQSNYYGWI